MISSVGYFIGEATWSTAILLLFAAVGLGPILLFKKSIRFHFLASPLAGLLLVNTGALAVYFIFHVRYGTAALSAACLCGLASIILCIAYRENLRARDALTSAVVLAAAAAGFAWLSNAAAITNGAPSIMYFDGTDHLGYANVADWMRDHIGWPGVAMPGLEGPRADPAHPYESLPNIELSADPRTGAFGYLALIGVIRRLPSTFAYDPASGVFLSAAVLGVAAVFARTWFILALFALGLVFSSWYELVHAGYLGKATAYPAILFCLGLFLASRRISDLRVLLTVLVFCAASALQISGLVTAAVFASLGGSALLTARFFDKSADWDQFSKLAICVFVSVLAGGFFIHPQFGSVGGAGPSYPASYVASRSLDLEGWTAAAGFGETTFYLMVATTMLAGVCGASIAVARRASGALTLLIVPIAIYAGLLLLTPRGELLQTTGLLYPAMLCGFGLLLSEWDVTSRGILRVTAIACLIITAALRAPHAYAAALRYTSAQAITGAYSKDEIDRIANTIGERATLVDVGKNPHQAILMLVELGRRGPALQWTADGWHFAVAGWRGWPLPKYDADTDFRIVSVDRKNGGEAVYAGPHFAVLRR
jgi:hypothetical protein